MQKIRFYKVIRCLTLLAILTLIAGACGIEHIRILRDAQDDFSVSARVENTATIKVLFPDAEYLSELAESWLANENAGSFCETSSIFMTERHQYLFHSYQDIYLRLHALEKNAGARLKADGLYGTAEALRIFARWRATFYAHALRVGNTTITAPEDIPTLTEINVEAQNLLKKFPEQLYPRDRFFLEAMPALVRYDIAVLRVAQDCKLNRLEKTSEGKKRGKEIIEQITTAEEDLYKISGQQYRHLEKYKLLARYTMLRSARSLADHVGFKMNDEKTRDELPILAQSINRFLGEVEDSVLLKDLLDESKVKPSTIKSLLPPIGPPGTNP